MGAAHQNLSTGELEAIARELLTGVLPGTVKGRVSSHCPMHAERTPGGAFFYDPADDVGYCHSCGQGTDIIGLFNLVQGNDVDDPQGFREFFERYAPGRIGERGQQRTVRVRREGWQPRPSEPSPELWRRKAAEFVAKRAARLLETPEALAALARWGIAPETAKACRIGWMHERRFYRFTAWGLPYAANEKGNEKCILAPEGFVFPCYQRGELVRVKVRLHNPAEGQPKYRAMEGSGASYGIWGKPDATRVWVVLETERDAILCWQELRRYGVGAMSSGSATIAPDAFAHALLSRADCIVNALDNDHAGRKKSWSFLPEDHRFAWSQYPHAVRWLVPSVIGKDVGDLPAAGISVWDWLRLGLPPHIRAICERMAASPLQQREGRAPVLLEWPAPEALPEGVDRQAYRDMLVIAAEHGVQVQVQGDDVRPVHRAGAAPKSDELDFVAGMLEMQPPVIAMLRAAACAQGVAA